ncbi:MULTISPECIES: hypothetical protein [unclassified Leuconostoc]|jgi:hypothetical protein|uniref:hypothetical protein n=1 Tax=unclassified Leuconostoc TaxID=2685106 RepID=UPI0019045A13|nr:MULTISPECIES: hypothetical protein [unclassified Leuconostoc]MBK0039780.1 hypothetical protein [Leuconostoc sp. S51]MBK0050739.1 hypothetical protein [Leuconostoc sp. S50]
MTMIIKKSHQSDSYYTLKSNGKTMTYALLGQRLDSKVLTNFEQEFANFLVNEDGTVMFNVKVGEVNQLNKDLSKY